MDFTFGKVYHRWLYFIGLLGIAFGLSVSKVVLSIGVIWIGVNWLWEGGYAEKWRLLTARNSVVILILFFLLHVIGVFWSLDPHEGWRDVRIKLPLLIVPLVMGTSEALPKKWFETILAVFVAGVLIAATRTFLIASGVIPKVLTDIRQASDLVPLIRLALFSALAVMLLGRWFFQTKNLGWRIFFLLISVWLAFFLFYMQSLTGLIILVVGFAFVGIIIAIQRKKRKLLSVLLFGGIGAASVIGFFTWRAYHDFYELRGNEIPELKHRTASGAWYEHHLDIPMYENGHKVMVNICWGELEREWMKRSKVPFFDGKDKKGNQVRYTLVRYMASKGLVKDAEGISKLTDEEIREVENGSSNCRDKERTQLETRIYQVFWETYYFSHGGDPSGSSIAMRLVVANAALTTISNAPFIGKGTGSQQKAYKEFYQSRDVELNEKWQWLHAHNQFLSIGATLGIPALLFFIFMLWWPAKQMYRWKNYLYLSFFLVVFLSFFNDDTLETQQGVSFFAFFNSLLLFAMPFAVTSAQTDLEKSESPSSVGVQ